MVEEPDLGRGVEAEPEQEAERIHVPALADHAEQPAEQAREQTAAVRQHRVDVLRGVAAAALHALEGAVDVDQDDHVDRRDDQQERRRHRGADQAADVLEAFELVLEGRRRERDADGRQHHHGGMAEREIEPERDRPLALLHQLAGGVVDRGDVVGIDRVAQPEAVGQQAGGEQDRMVVERDQRPGPGGDVGGDQHDVDGDDLAAQVGVAVVEGTQHRHDMNPVAQTDMTSRAGTSYRGKMIFEEISYQPAAAGQAPGASLDIVGVTSGSTGTLRRLPPPLAGVPVRMAVASCRRRGRAA